MTMTTGQLVAGNYFDKYRSTNPLYRRLVAAFLSSARELVGHANPRRILEVGAGPGDLGWALFGGSRDDTKLPLMFCGTDISLQQMQSARKHYPYLSFLCASAIELPFADHTFDLCVACEVLEHLADPQAALAEIARVLDGYLLVSVPWEPVWRVLNVLRGKYMTRLGNTPGHVQHFGRRRIRAMVQLQFEIATERTPFPWTMILAKRRSD